jgi:hypothetical protein
MTAKKFNTAPCCEIYCHRQECWLFLAQSAVIGSTILRLICTFPLVFSALPLPTQVWQ